MSYPRTNSSLGCLECLESSGEGSTDKGVNILSPSVGSRKVPLNQFLFSSHFTFSSSSS